MVDRPAHKRSDGTLIREFYVWVLLSPPEPLALTCPAPPAPRPMHHTRRQHATPSSTLLVCLGPSGQFGQTNLYTGFLTCASAESHI